MKAEAVANGARSGRNPEEGERGPDGTDALAGREPENTDALAGREAQDTAPEPETDTSTRTLTKHEAIAPKTEADADAPAGPKAAPTDPQTRTLAGREPKGTAPESETDIPTRTLTKREANTPQAKADTPAGPKAAPTDPRTRDLAGGEPKDAAPESETDAPVGTLAGSGAEGARAGQGDADALVRREAPDAEPEPAKDTPGVREPAGTPAGREAADAARGGGADAGSGTGTPAEREPVRASESTAADEGTGTAPEPDDDAPARASGGAGSAAGAGTTTGQAESGDEPAAGSGSGARETPDGDAAGDRSGGPAHDASAAGGMDRPRPSWAKGDTPEGDDPAHGTAPARAENRPRPSSAKGDAPKGDNPADDTAPARAEDRPRPSSAKGDTAEGDNPADGTTPARAGDRPRPSWAKAGDGEGSPAGKGAGAPSPAREAPTPRKGAAAQPHDPERTSEFVALKDLDAVRPSQPQPQPAQRPVLEPTRETPLPPLELLAELTNTAPPPETPRRILTRRVKVWTPIVLLLGGGIAGAQMLRPLPAPTFVTEQTSHTLEGSTTIPWPAKGQAAVRFPGSGVISTFGEQKPVPTASVGKVMTAYVILKNHPLRKNEPGPGIEIDAKAVAEGKSEDESRIKDLTLGQKFSEQDMLKMMMIPSANNIARQLARWDSGNDEAAFVAKMNAAAKELGMRDTTYTDPSGLDAGTVSTAVDQLKLAEAVMREEAFRQIVELASSPVKGRTQAVDNNNTLLSVRGLGAVGIKTGSSTPAGGTLMWAADKKVGGESPLILGVMMEQRVDGPDPNAAKSLELVLNNSRKIIEAVRNTLAPATVIRKGQPVGHVSDGLGGSTPLVAAKDLTVVGVPGQQLRLSLGAGAKPLPHEAKAGTEVGVLTVGDGLGAKTVPVAVGTDLVEPSFGARVTRLS
ncbi:D-alanyl-D-alanine carboxypeptidase [Streptomyces sp. NPDC058734]|uniref:D-alanyl-D-alanine carboxypeptidase n=1 Tax=Streptomyces sp. NPDC058734 TaxID=3346615 RepID=UPI0036B3FD62